MPPKRTRAVRDETSSSDTSSADNTPKPSFAPRKQRSTFKTTKIANIASKHANESDSNKRDQGHALSDGDSGTQADRNNHGNGAFGKRPKSGSKVFAAPYDGGSSTRTGAVIGGGIFFVIFVLFVALRSDAAAPKPTVGGCISKVSSDTPAEVAAAVAELTGNFNHKPVRMRRVAVGGAKAARSFAQRVAVAVEPAASVVEADTSSVASFARSLREATSKPTCVIITIPDVSAMDTDAAAGLKSVFELGQLLGDNVLLSAAVGIVAGATDEAALKAAVPDRVRHMMKIVSK
jgi:hypothetical protein